MKVKISIMNMFNMPMRHLGLLLKKGLKHMNMKLKGEDHIRD